MNTILYGRNITHGKHLSLYEIIHTVKMRTIQTGSLIPYYEYVSLERVKFIDTRTDCYKMGYTVTLYNLDPMRNDFTAVRRSQFIRLDVANEHYDAYIKSASLTNGRVVN